MSHTPGQWELSDAEDDTFNGGQSRQLRGNMNWLGDVRANNEEDDANARLIAAGPELLLACKAVLAALNAAELDGLWIDAPYQLPGVHESAQERLAAAIAKAEGKENEP